MPGILTGHGWVRRCGLWLVSPDTTMWYPFSSHDLACSVINMLNLFSARHLTGKEVKLGLHAPLTPYGAVMRIVLSFGEVEVGTNRSTVGVVLDVGLSICVFCRDDKDDPCGSWTEFEVLFGHGGRGTPCGNSVVTNRKEPVITEDVGHLGMAVTALDPCLNDYSNVGPHST